MDILEWQWADLMPGDKIRFSKVVLEHNRNRNYWNRWAIENCDKILTVKKIVEDENLLIYIREHHSQPFLSINLDGTNWQGIQLLEIVELAKD